jgi:hypothetical protein
MYAKSSYDDHDNYDDYTHVDLVHKQKISSK